MLESIREPRKGGFPSGSVTKNLSGMQETQETGVLSLSKEDPLEEEMAAHSSILAWEIPWTEEAGGLQSMGSQRVRHDCSDRAHVHTYTYICHCRNTDEPRD